MITRISLSICLALVTAGAFLAGQSRRSEAECFERCLDTDCHVLHSANTEFLVFYDAPCWFRSLTDDEGGVEADDENGCSGNVIGKYADLSQIAETDPGCGDWTLDTERFAIGTGTCELWGEDPGWDDTMLLSCCEDPQGNENNDSCSKP